MCVCLLDTRQLVGQYFFVDLEVSVLPLLRRWTIHVPWCGKLFLQSVLCCNWIQKLLTWRSWGRKLWKYHPPDIIPFSHILLGNSVIAALPFLLWFSSLKPVHWASLIPPFIVGERFGWASSNCRCFSSSATAAGLQTDCSPWFRRSCNIVYTEQDNVFISSSPLKESAKSTI